jgi:hypothetical protein
VLDIWLVMELFSYLLIKLIAVCSQIHTKHINTPCGLNVEFLDIKLAVYIVTIAFIILTLIHLVQETYFRVFAIIY